MYKATSAFLIYIVEGLEICDRYAGVVRKIQSYKIKRASSFKNLRIENSFELLDSIFSHTYKI